MSEAPQLEAENIHETQAGIIDSFRPDPSRRFYKLDQNLLWAQGLTPTQKLVLIDFFHRYSAHLKIPSIPVRAKLIGIGERTLREVEAALEKLGCLLSRETPGKVKVYFAAFPPSPPPEDGEPATEDRLNFLKAFRILCEFSDREEISRYTTINRPRRNLPESPRRNLPESSGEICRGSHARTTPPPKMDKDPLTPQEEKSPSGMDADASVGFLSIPPPPPPPKKPGPVPTPSPEEKPTKKGLTADEEATRKQLWEAFCAVWGHRLEGRTKNVIVREREGIASLQMQGISPEQVRVYAAVQMALPFWQGKHFSAQTVAKNIGAWLNSPDGLEAMRPVGNGSAQPVRRKEPEWDEAAWEREQAAFAAECARKKQRAAEKALAKAAALQNSGGAGAGAGA